MLIDFNTLFPKYNIKPKGVLHIGASTGQETQHYVNLGVTDIVYIEALPSVFKELVANVSNFKAKFTCINACVSEIDNAEVTFNQTNNEGQSSSMLEFGTHTKQHPTVKVIKKMTLKTSRVDSIFNNYNISSDQYDFLNIDLQGAELIALKSMSDLLKSFTWVYLEVNNEPLYKDCPLVGEIDKYLLTYGFKGVEEKWTSHGWGDKLYIKIQ